MKKKLFVMLLLFQSVLYSQESIEIDADDNLVVEESSFRNFNGSLFIKNDAVYLNATECDFIGKEAIKLNLDEKATKKWKKKISKNDNLIPEATVVDAQINYAIPAYKLLFKVGGTNIGGKDYIQVIGAGSIGQQWFASLTINP